MHCQFQTYMWLWSQQGGGNDKEDEPAALASELLQGGLTWCLSARRELQVSLQE